MLNDFAGPIINAFLTGKQLKRQSEQDAIAEEQRKLAIKNQQEELKRTQKRFETELALDALKVDELLRNQVASGMRQIPVERMNLPGNLPATPMAPIAQMREAMIPSAAQELPLQATQQAVQVPAMQLGQEFGLPETNAAQNSIVDLGALGKFDLRNYPSPDEVFAIAAKKANMQAQAKATEEGMVEAAKFPFAQSLQAQKDTAAEKRVQTQVAGNKEIAGTRQQIQTSQFNQKLQLDRDRLEQERKLGEARISLGYARSFKDKVSDADKQAARADTIEAFAKGTYTKEDINKLIPQSGREQFVSDLRAVGVVPYSEEQRNSIVQFQQMADFAKRAKDLSVKIESGLLQGLPWTDADNLITGLLADTENFGRGVKAMRGVFSDKDINLLKGAYPSAQWRQNRSADNLTRVNKIINDLVFKFNDTYKNFPDSAKAKLAKETGLLDLMAVD